MRLPLFVLVGVVAFSIGGCGTQAPASTTAPSAATGAAAQDRGKASGIDARIVVPAAAVRQADSLQEMYVVPGSNSKDVLAFYQRALPAVGWKIDAKTSDFEGKTPGTGGTRIINVCMAPAVWRSVLIGDGTGGAEFLVMALPDTDPCRP